MATAEERRRSNTLWARQRRERALDVARRGLNVCPRRAGPGKCGGVLEHIVRRDGTVYTVCPKCDRRNRGICADCPAPVEGRIGSAMRCRACKRKARAMYVERYRQRDPELYRRKWKRQTAARRADPERRAHDLAVKKAWRERNVVRIKLQKRKWRLNPNRPNGYSSREKYEAYHRAYRAKHAARRRELARRRYYELHPERPHPVCACGCEQPIPWGGNGRPAKWLREHCPYPRALTPKEICMKASARAINMLEVAAEKVRKKLAGAEELQQELGAIEKAIAALREVPTEGTEPIRRRRLKTA